MTHRTKLTIFTLARWATIGSVMLTAIAMQLYPGGTAHDPFKTMDRRNKLPGPGCSRLPRHGLLLRSPSF
jgi:hypothetical protein